ncbi:hypothetical protein BGZ94_010121 [Podila epigama]|nr:hypothetical protein BGZ94_010121 [Podila epigama]
MIQRRQGRRDAQHSNHDHDDDIWSDTNESCTSEKEFYGDFVLQPRLTVLERRLAQEARTRRARERSKAVQKAIRSLHIFPEILERICSFASQTVLQHTICRVCKTWYLAAAPFIRKQGRWVLGSQKSEDILLTRMVTLNTLVIHCAYDHSETKDRVAPFNSLEPGLKRFRKTITDPIEEVMPTLAPLHHPFLNHPGNSHGRSAAYRIASITAQQARSLGKTCLLDFPRRLVLHSFSCDSSPKDFWPFLPHLGHIHTLEILGWCESLDLMLLLTHCSNLEVFTFTKAYSNCSMTFNTTNIKASTAGTDDKDELEALTIKKYPGPYNKLRHFSAKHAFITSESILHLFEAMPSLEHFTLICNFLTYLPRPVNATTWNIDRLYSHAAEHCPRLEHIQIIQETRESCQKEETEALQKNFPQITHLAFMDTVRKLPISERLSPLFYGRMTHIDIMKNPYGLGWSCGPVIDLLMRSGPNLVSFCAPHEFLNDSHVLPPVKKSYYFPGERDSNGVKKRKARLAKRIARQVAKNEIRELPHPTQWMCHNLHTLKIGLFASTDLYWYLVRQCPRLVDLTLTVYNLDIGQVAPEATTRYFKRKHEPPHIRIKFRHRNYDVGKATTYVQRDNSFSILGQLQYLEHLRLEGDCKGKIDIDCFRWMGERVQLTRRRHKRDAPVLNEDETECFKHWSRMVRFKMCFKNAYIDFATLEPQLLQLRPGIAFSYFNGKSYAWM